MFLTAYFISWFGSMTIQNEAKCNSLQACIDKYGSQINIYNSRKATCIIFDILKPNFPQIFLRNSHKTPCDVSNILSVSLQLAALDLTEETFSTIEPRILQLWRKFKEKLNYFLSDKTTWQINVRGTKCLSLWSLCIFILMFPFAVCCQKNRTIS